MIPENYVPDLGVRMSLYRRLSDLADRAGIESFAAELIDRFGPIPPEVENLMEIVAIKQLCRAAGVDRVDAGPKGALIGFHKDVPPNVPALMVWLNDQRGAIKLRPDQRLSVLRQWDEVKHRVKGIERILSELADLASSQFKAA
jgi:transcription-repair coupling factor (superfamily II helicase)